MTMAFKYYNGAAYDDELRRCPECGGVVAIIGKFVACTECETVWNPNVTDMIKAWWNNEQETEPV